MKLNIRDKDYSIEKSNFLIIGVYEDKKIEGVPEDIEKIISYYKKEEKFKGTCEETSYFTLQAEIGFREVFLLGLGKGKNSLARKLEK